MPKIYLDTSAIVKRYIREKGSGAASLTYSMADAGNLTISFSLWNVGETIGVIDQYEQRGWITREQSRKVLSNLAGETLRLIRIMALEVLPVNSSMLTDAWSLIRQYHIYEADALQIVAGRHSGAQLFLAADERLLDTASKEGLKVLNVEREDEVRESLSSLS